MAELPETMQAAVIDEEGGPEAVHTATVPVPKLDRGEVLIRVNTAGVGIWDKALVAGDYSDGQTGYPRIYGAEGAGTVVDVGPGVQRLKPGDLVYGYGFGNAKGGSFAEYIALPQDHVAPIPDGLTPSDAGVLAVSGLTALEGLLELRAEPGDPIVITGASGGVGHVAIQLAKRMGLLVFAIASGDDGVTLALEVGADSAVDGKRDDFVAAARAWSEAGFAGALVLAAADDGWAALMKLVHGRIAYPNGVTAPVGHEGARAVAYDGDPKQEVFAQLAELNARDPLRLEVTRTYSLDETPQALRDIGAHHVGKLAIKVQ